MKTEGESQKKKEGKPPLQIRHRGIRVDFFDGFLFANMPNDDAKVGT
jgi:hypothetical protein